MADFLDVVNPTQGGLRAVGGLFDDSDDQLAAIDRSNQRIDRAQDRLQGDYKGLIEQFDLGLGQYREDSRNARIDASNDLKMALSQETDSFIAGLGPLNEVSKARIKSQIEIPALRKMVEFDLGTTETDLNTALSSLMTSMQLGREQHQLYNQGTRAMSRNLGARESIRRNAPSGFEKWLQGSKLGLQAVNMGRSMGGV